jgi:uncharacterized protein
MSTHIDSVDQLYRTLEPENDDVAVSVIVKLRGELCDIDCLYCYEKRKEAPGGARIGPEDIDRLGAVFGDRPLVIELHGGEPLTMGRPAMAQILDALRRQPMVVRVSMQTNGVLLDDAWMDLFDERYPDLSIGVSLDGDAAANSWRVDYAANPTYPRVVKALQMLARRGRTIGVIAAVTPRSLGRGPELLDHLTSFGSVGSVSFVPSFDSSVRRATQQGGRRQTASRLLQVAAVAEDEGPTWAVTPDEYADFVLAVTGHWIRSGLFNTVKLEPAVSTIRRIRGLSTTFCHFSQLKCDHVFTLYPDGRFGSCDELPWPAAQLTTLPEVTDTRQIVAAQRTLPLLVEGRGLMSKCVTCDYQTSCGGGCIATRIRARNGGSDDPYCDYRMRLVDGIAALLAQPSRAGVEICRRAHWRRREPNVMADVARFVTTWDDPAAQRSPASLRHSEHGNINTVGAGGVHEAPDLDPRHPQWRAGIESGVWPLVDAVTSGWGCVTYDSCAGHRYEGSRLAPVPRNIGILPRSPGEHARIAAALCRVVTEVELELPPACRLLLARTELTSRASGGKVAVLDLRIESAGDWAAYFDAVDLATDLVTGALQRTAPDGKSCGCATTTDEVPAAERAPVPA